MRYLEASNSWTHVGWTGEAVGILFNRTEFLLGVIRKSSRDRQLHKCGYTWCQQTTPKNDYHGNFVMYVLPVRKLLFSSSLPKHLHLRQARKPACSLSIPVSPGPLWEIPYVTRHLREVKEDRMTKGLAGGKAQLLTSGSFRNSRLFSRTSGKINSVTLGEIFML